jgi:hypothetical protein
VSLPGRFPNQGFQMEPRDRKDTERTPAFAWWFPRERAVRSLTSNEFPLIAQRASAMRVFPSLEFVGRNGSPKRNNDSTMSSPLSLVSPDSLHRLAFDILLHNGVPPDRAEMVAHGLVLADLRGIDTHGINRSRATSRESKQASSSHLRRSISSRLPL